MTAPIDLYFWPLTDSDEADRLTPLLSDAEAARAARFVQARDRTAYRIGRGGLRARLGAIIGQPAQSLTFDLNLQGKPSLRGGPFFNLSHSGGLACLAVSPDHDLGVDIEAFREVEDGVARRFFAPGEYADLCALPGPDWQAGFFRCWTRKEAVVKAIGEGLSLPLDTFDVTLRPGAPARMTRLEGGDPAAWRLAHLDLGPRMVGALAIRVPTLPRLVLREVPDGQPCHVAA